MTRKHTVHIWYEGMRGIRKGRKRERGVKDDEDETCTTRSTFPFILVRGWFFQFSSILYLLRRVRNISTSCETAFNRSVSSVMMPRVPSEPTNSSVKL